jgi:hypothetical protein
MTDNQLFDCLILSELCGDYRTEYGPLPAVMY